MNERPINFNTEMVQAILGNRKFQTRRPIKGKFPWLENPKEYYEVDFYDRDYFAEVAVYQKNGIFGWYENEYPDEGMIKFKCPYGEIGDRLKVVEKENGIIVEDFFEENQIIEITGIRVERLKEITEEDAIAEGMTPELAVKLLTGKDYLPYCIMVGGIKMLWNSIYGKDAWDKNDWIWVIEFKKIDNRGNYNAKPRQRQLHLPRP